MIKIIFYRNKSGVVCGFKMTDHAESRVCSAVSALALNTANSIEAFTEADIEAEYDESGGFLRFTLVESDGKLDENAVLLLASLELGILSIASQHSGEISVSYKNIRMQKIKSGNKFKSV